MRKGIRHTAILLLALTVLSVVIACGGGAPSEAKIEATVETRVELAKASPTIPAPVPTRKPERPTAIPTPNIEATVQARLVEERAAETAVEAKAQVMAKSMIKVTAEAMTMSAKPPIVPTVIAPPEPTPEPTVTPKADITSGLSSPTNETCSQTTPALRDVTSFQWLERPMRSGDAATIQFSPSNPDIVYLAIEVNHHTLYRSDNGGRTWKKLHAFDHAKDLAIHPKNPGIMFLNESKSVYRIQSGGGSVQELREGTILSKVLESPGGFGDAGTTWSSVTISSSDPDVVYVAMKGGGPTGKGGALYRSDTGGLSFKRIEGKFPQINVVFVDPANPTKVFIGGRNGIYRSLDSGRMLTRVGEVKNVVDIDSFDGSLMFAATSEGIFQSQDNGITWYNKDEGLSTHTVLRVRVSPSNPSDVWVTTDKGVYRSNDHGTTWNNASENLPAKNVQALSIHPQSSDIVLVSTETFNFSVRSQQLYTPGQYYRQGIYRTDDGGTTWLRSDSGIIEDHVVALTAHPTRPSEVWGGAGASRGLYRSRDAGQSWSLSPSWLNHYPMQMAFFPDRPDAFVATGSHGGQDFGVTLDSGVNWFTLSERTFLSAIRFDEDHFIQRGVGGNVHLHAIAVDPSNPQTVYVGSIHDPTTYSAKALIGSHIFKSLDGGVTWEEIGDNYPREIETAIRIITIDPHQSNIIYLGTSEQESVVGNGLWVSDNAGQTWTHSNDGLPTNASINAIVVHPTKPGMLLVGTQQGMYRSSDAAQTWYKVSDSHVWDAEFNPQYPEDVYMGTTNGLLFSADFGETWNQVLSGQLKDDIMAIAVNCNGSAVYVSDLESGVLVGFSESSAPIARDQSIGVERGEFTSNEIDSRNESSK